ncbi:glycosyl transferase family 2 [Nitrospira lenta]|uniref:Glycosyl transferase, family 2 n=1 Tax=Nitrospira lenta TaxID=1436998 RepID=A0A330L7Z8_9BACT|nr:glycosyl transferase family 2 [Nitrospira lenta]SPP65243.1 Glycosyl transferase, family 2 [Nitrospira lenta]
MTHMTAWEQVQAQCPDLRKADLLVGLPTFNHGSTVELVVKSVMAGLAAFLPQVSVVVVNADAGSQDGTPDIIKRAVGSAVPVVSVQYLTGGLSAQPAALDRLSESGVAKREAAFRAFFTIAEKVEAKACVVMDAQLRSVTPEWIERLAQPVLEQGADFVAPVFRRQRYEGSLTNSLIAPLTRALYGKRVACQSGGGYGFSARLTNRCLAKDLWEGETAKYGIDNWLTTVAVAEGFHVWQAFLGAKVQDSKASGQDVSFILAQAVGAAYHYMEQYQEVWEQRKESSAVPAVGAPYGPGDASVAINVERMVKGFRQGLRDLLPIWESILAPDTLAGILTLGLEDEEEFRFPIPLWTQTVYDFAIAYHEKVIHREHLLKSLTPLYLGRTASLVLETKDGEPGDADRAGERVCESFESMKPYLVGRWRFQ